MKRLWRLVRWPVAALVLLAAVLAAPIAYVELACRGGERAAPYRPIITDAAYRRAEANSYLTYPEWHIVYAYEGLAETLRSSDEHAFDYASAVAGFWNAYCALNEAAQDHGGADAATRQTIYVIGVSFTIEMALKAAYEETAGRLFASLRGPDKTPQDQVVEAQAAEYAAFLHQTPWYKYPFDAAREKLWAAPLIPGARGWERRLGIGAEWWTKAAYAGVIDGAVAATGEAQLEIRSVIGGLSAPAARAIPDLKVVGSSGDRLIIETPRYARFTEILREVSAKGGIVIEIAGNDDVLISAVDAAPSPSTLPEGASLLASIPRDGFGDRRVLLGVKVPVLSRVIASMRRGPLRLEHVYDY
jgi:hypothetical protein